MGKGTDKLYITHSEWSSTDAFSAAAGAGLSKPSAAGSSFRRLPFNFCALSLQPFAHPLCTAAGTTFDLTNILPWIKKHGTNPVNGEALKSADLIKLSFAKNDDGEYVDPVTFKPFTDNSHIVALKNTGNVFAWDTIERLNIKPKNWRDLVSEEDFTRKDIITLQDPEHLAMRDLSSFKYIQEGTSTLTDEQRREREDPASGINTSAMGSSAKILKAREAVAKVRAERTGSDNTTSTSGNSSISMAKKANGAGSSTSTPMQKPKTPYNAALHTTGQAAASFTSTGLTPHTSADLALLTDEQFLLKPRRVKTPGHVLLRTTHGTLSLTLHTEFAPKAVWNFLRLTKRGYYNGVKFHRNIRNFMLQGGDPTGTGRGGESCWGAGKPFADEWAASPLRHDGRGVLSMANKGKNTNTSQFFITYRVAKHLDLKHTVFGRVDVENDAESGVVLTRLENVKTGGDDRPVEECGIEEVVVVVDPFEEFMKNKAENEEKEREREEIARQGGAEDDLTTWTGKRIRAGGKAAAGDGERDVGVGKYLGAGGDAGTMSNVEQIVEEWDTPVEPPAKKRKAGGFGNFDSW